MIVISHVTFLRGYCQMRLSFLFFDAILFTRTLAARICCSIRFYNIDAILSEVRAVSGFPVYPVFLWLTNVGMLRTLLGFMNLIRLFVSVHWYSFRRMSLYALGDTGWQSSLWREDNYEFMNSSGHKMLVMHKSTNFQWLTQFVCMWYRTIQPNLVLMGQSLELQWQVRCMSVNERNLLFLIFFCLFDEIPKPDDSEVLICPTIWEKGKVRNKALSTERT
jgi:hypothetical protein